MQNTHYFHYVLRHVHNFSEVITLRKKHHIGNTDIGHYIHNDHRSCPLTSEVVTLRRTSHEITDIGHYINNDQRSCANFLSIL